MEGNVERRVAAGVRVAQDGNGGFALDVANGRIYQLNLTGAFVLQALVQGCTSQDLVARLTERCHVPHLQAEQDVADFLLETDRAGLTERCSAVSAEA